MNDRLAALIERHEGRKNKPYLCQAGHNTIGVGHNMDARPLPANMQVFLARHGYLTDGLVDDLLALDLNDAIADAARVVGPAWATIDEARQAAIIDMAFNLGGAGLGKFKLFLAAVRQHDWPRAADEIRNSAYYRQLGGNDPDSRPEEVIQILTTGRMPD